MPYDFNPETTHEIKNPKYAGVTFTVHALTESIRLRVRILLASTNAKVREMMDKHAEVLAMPEGPQRDVLSLSVLSDVQDLIDSEVTPVWVRAMLVSVDGFTIKGQPVTADSLISSAPRDLYVEIARVIRKEAGLTDDEMGESEPRTTSDDSAATRTSNLTVISAAK